MALYDLEYAQSMMVETWTKIPAGGEVSLTGILDKQLESATEITLYVRKAAAGSEAAGEAAGIKLPVRPKKPDPIQGTDVTEFQNLRMVSFSGSQGLSLVIGLMV